MAKTTFLAIDPAGNVHTRKTERTYTHAVLERASKEWAIHHATVVSAKWGLDSAREQFAYATWTVEQFNEMLLRKKCGILTRDNRYAEESIAKAKAFVAQWGTPEAYVEARVTEELAKIEARDWTVWTVAGFNGRRDLAEKLVADRRSKPFIAEAIIVDAVKK